MSRSFRFAPLMLTALAWAAFTGSARAEEGALAVALSEQAATRATAVSTPEIAAPVGVSAIADQAITIQADATDPNAGDILTITQSGAPASLVFSHTPDVSPVSATLSGTLTAADVGTYNILWEVSDGTFSASASTALDVTANHDPTIDAPATYLGAATIDMSFPVTVSDPDNDRVNSIAATPLPSGATFTVNALRTSGEFHWVPAVGQEGDYSVTFAVASGSPERTASAVTAIHVMTQDHPPIVNSPGTVNAVAGLPISVTATASDPDGDPITEFVAEGTQSTDLPAGAVFTTNASNTAGTLDWTPTLSQIGNVGINIIARSGVVPTSGQIGLRTVKVTRIVVRADRAPVVTAPATVSAMEGSLLTVNVTASDPDAQTPIASLTAAPLPLGAAFSSNPAHTSGTLSWTPDFSQGGTYNVVFTAANALTGTATTSIVVGNQNRAPSANAGGPYNGTAGAMVSFNGSGSSDPDGDVLTYAWGFGDSHTGSGANPSHAYAAGSTYNVTLHVTDPGALFDDAATTATIVSQVSAEILLESFGSTIDVRKTGNRFTKIGLEETTFPYTDLIPSSIRVSTTFPNSGFVTECAADPRSFVSGDLNANGIPDIDIRFGNKCLANLFNNVPDNTLATVVITGQFSPSGITVPLQAQRDLTIRVKHRTSPILASASPNPFNPETAISYTVMNPGSVTIKVYSVDGRLVRTLKQGESSGAGTYEVTWNGTDDTGHHVSSGIYFVKSSQRAGTVETSNILKVTLAK